MFILKDLTNDAKTADNLVLGQGQALPVGCLGGGGNARRLWLVPSPLRGSMEKRPAFRRTYIFRSSALNYEI